MPNQRRIKSKKLKHHFISISATSILLLSSLVSSGTAIAYAAETHSLTNTNQKDQNNTNQKTPSISNQSTIPSQQSFKVTKIDPYVEGDNQFISGTYTGEAPAYIRILVNGEKKTLLSMKGVPKGTFKYYISGLKTTDHVTLQLFDSTYKILSETAIVIKKMVPVKVTKIDPYVEGNTSFVTGSYTGDGVTYMRLVVNGKKMTLIDISKLSKGTFKYFVTNLKATDTVELQLFDGNYRQLITEKIPIKNAKKVAITHVDPYIEGTSQHVSGSYTGDEVAYMRLTVNGEKKPLLATNNLPKGTFNYFDNNLKITDKVSIELFDGDYRVVGEANITIQKPEIVNITQVDPYTEGKSQFISGHYTGTGAAYMQVIVNGKKQALVPMSGLPKNTFRYYQANLKKKDKVMVILYNKYYQQLATKEISISDEVYKQEIQTTPYPSNTASAGIRMGQEQDRQDLGIQLAQGSIITIKQTNPNFHGNLTLRLLTNKSSTESSIDFSSNKVSLAAKQLAVPFVDTPYNQPNGEKPTIEFTVEGPTLPLPKFHKGSDLNTFKNTWNQTKGYALIQGKRFQSFFPEENRVQACQTDLTHVIDMYDNEIIGFYNQLIGLSDDNPNPLNRSSVRRYFYKADANGPGGLYYGPRWTAQTSSSAVAWLSDGWGALHETGHGYQGSFMNQGMTVGEVWNNIYGVIYNYKHMGKATADSKSWLYGYGNKANLENSLKTTITGSAANFNNQGSRQKLIILSNIIDKAGNEGLQNFYVKYRELANTSGFNPAAHSLPDLLVTNLGSPKKYDFSAVLTSWGLNVSKETKQQAKSNGDTLVAHLAQVVPNNKLNDAIQKLTQNNRLSSVLSLVTNQELSALNLKSNVTLNFTDEKLFDGVKMRIMDGDKVYKEITLNKGPVVLNDMPNGVYSLELETTTGYLKNPYIFVRDNGTINIDLVSYLKEASVAVDRLFENNGDTLIKPTIMQKDIDQVRKQVNALPDSSQKQALLQKLTAAFNQLQELSLSGLANNIFATLDVAHGVATLRTNAGRPHVYFTGQYARITVKRGNNVIFDKNYIGDVHQQAKVDTIHLQDGDKMTITHKEAGTRFIVNHPNLKPNNSGTYYYVVEKGQLVIDDLTYVTNTVNQLFENNSDTLIKPTIMQKDIDNVTKQVRALPESSQKQALLQKLTNAFNQLQEFTLSGLSNNIFATLDVAHGVATLRTSPRRPHFYFTGQYTHITIKHGNNIIFDKDYIGNLYQQAKVDTIHLQDGDTVTITHKEAGTRFIVNHPDLKTNSSGIYTYTVQHGILVLNK
ncbi:immunoglobulin-like domain-containing protein [Enterococcus hirae]